MAKHDFYLELKDKKGREDLFTSITNVKEFLTLKLNMLEILLSQWSGKQESLNLSFPYLHVEDKNLHRAFIVSNNKIVSFGFGFTVKTNENHVEYLICKKNRFNTKAVSEAHVILNQLGEEELYREISFEDDEDIPSAEGIKLFELLLFEEPSYLRYDFDQAASKGSKAKIHPPHHFDFCFTPNYTYKFGLPQKIQEKDFQNILQASDYCRTLSLNHFRPRIIIKNKRRKNIFRVIINI
ncbi:MAG: hypothetical protein L6V92_05270 [Phocaeicola vulgatus]|nr:MAG: hypothetical protein L6V92_05270 [Phocaeicola vulgatus]